jgi:hypothetical protein
MPRKQTTPLQSDQLEEIKRKARASQEARLQRTINRLHRQESNSGAADIITTEPYRLDPLRTTVKYYAVRRGRTTTLFTSAGRFVSKGQVLNYPGAEFKAFNTYEAALGYLGLARQSSEDHSRQAHISTSCSTATNLTAAVEASTQTTRDLGLRIYFESIALGFIIGVIAALWILPQL